MLQTIKKLLLGIVDDIDAGNSDIDEKEALQIAKMLKSMVRVDIPMSKYQSYTYLNISRATFDNMVRDGKIPKGRKMPGFKELVWFKRDFKKILK
jgi:predicted DNA-binding transcriptional regulator AlpA